MPGIATIAEESEETKTRRTISEIFIGLGLIETSSFHLSVKDDVKKMHFDFRDWIEVENSKTEYNVLRNDLLSGLLKIFSENSDSSYPQKIFEIGRTFSIDKSKETGISEKEGLACALTGEDVNFTEIKKILDYLFRMLDIEYKLEVFDNSNYINGRSARIIVNGKEIGIIGEISPRVLKNWKLKMPVSCFEIKI